MGHALRSLDDQIAAAAAYGQVIRNFVGATTGTATAATTSSGYTSGFKFPQNFVIPAVTAPVTGFYCTRLDMSVATEGTVLAAYATDLGSIAMATGTFTAGSAMPTRSVKDSMITTGAQLVVAVVEAALTATTPLITITYTDQDGNTGNTATMTLPTNAAVNTCFVVNPHLASADLSIKAITNLTKSAGSAGTLRFYGLHVIKSTSTAAQVAMNQVRQQGLGLVPWIANGGETIQFYKFGNTVADLLVSTIVLTPDV